MTEQVSLWDGVDQEKARDEALELVARRSKEYQAAARQWLADLGPGVTLTATDLRVALKEAGHEEPLDPRVLGAVFRSAGKDGVIEPTHAYRATGHHQRPQMVWRRPWTR